MPADVDHLALLDLELLDQEGAHVGVHVGADLELDDLAEAPPAKLRLDRAHEVVGLVGDGEVGVADDAEVGVAQHLHAREEAVEVARDHRLERHEGVVADVDSRGTTSFGTFTRANSSSPVTGSVSQTPRLSDRFEM